MSDVGEVDPLIVRQSVLAVHKEVLDNPGMYAGLFSESAQAADETDNADHALAYFAPAVRVVMDATILAANGHDPSEIPSEVADRMRFLHRVAKQVTPLFADTNKFTRYYRDLAGDLPRPHSLHDRFVDELLSDGGQVDTITAPQIREMAIVAGTAAKLLDARRQATGEVFDTQTQVSRSIGLLLVGRVTKFETRFLEYIGYPYARPELLEVVPVGDQPIARFSKAATEELFRRYINKDSGCPARDMSPVEYSGRLAQISTTANDDKLAPTNAMVQAWAQYAPWLLQPGYTVNEQIWPKRRIFEELQLDEPVPSLQDIMAAYNSMRRMR